MIGKNWIEFSTRLERKGTGNGNGTSRLVFVTWTLVLSVSLAPAPIKATTICIRKQDPEHSHSSTVQVTTIQQDSEYFTPVHPQYALMKDEDGQLNLIYKVFYLTNTVCSKHIIQIIFDVPL